MTETTSRTPRNEAGSPDALALMRQLILAKMRGAALGLVHQIFADEVRALCGEPYSRKGESGARRGGSEAGRVYLEGQAVAVRRPRVRRGDHEESLRAYAALQSYDLLSDAVQRKMLRGVSTRDYHEVLAELEGGLGLPASSVSRAFVRASQRSLDEINGRDLSKDLLVALFIDGLNFGDVMLIAAMGVTQDGRKVLLGVQEGHTENAVVVGDLLDNLKSRGLALSERFLAVIDGSKALKRAMLDRWHGRVYIQRCQVHKKRNVLDHLPRDRHPEVKRRLNVAYGMSDYDEALKMLKNTVAWLRQISEPAAASLEEGLEETLTVVKLALPDSLRRTFASTNPLESVFDSVRYRTGRVKRWRSPKTRMAARWAASALLLIEKRLHKIRGHRVMNALLNALSHPVVDGKKEVG